MWFTFCLLLFLDVVYDLIKQHNIRRKHNLMQQKIIISMYLLFRNSKQQTLGHTTIHELDLLVFMKQLVQHRQLPDQQELKLHNMAIQEDLIMISKINTYCKQLTEEITRHFQVKQKDLKMHVVGQSDGLFRMKTFLQTKQLIF